MFKNLNKTGKVKIIILVLLALPNLLRPIPKNPDQEMLAPIFMPLVFGIIAIPLISFFNKIFLGRKLTKPHWNENPLTLKKPLTFFHFGAFFFLVAGLSVILGSAIKYHFLNPVGLIVIAFGIGILIGVYLTLFLARDKK